VVTLVLIRPKLTEMIELFSTQPGKRGLGFDDFCTLLVRGGML
jgi:hypothetical protein